MDRNDGRTYALKIKTLKENNLTLPVGRRSQNPSSYSVICRNFVEWGVSSLAGFRSRDV